MHGLKALVFAALSAAPIMAMPGSSSSLVGRADPDDIMMFDCTNYKGRTLVDLCKSMCFGSFCAGNHQSLSHDDASASTQRDRARAAGCRPTPNRCSKAPYGKNYQCDEFPFKSVVDVKGGTRVNRCVPAKQNSDQSAIIKAFYGSSYCKGKNPCNFNTGYENSGNIAYCSMKTCKNDGNEYTKGGSFKIRRAGLDALDADVLFEPTSNISTITHGTHFLTSDGTPVRVPQGATPGQKIHRVSIPDWTAFDQYIEKQMAAQEKMTEDEYWQDQAAPASEELMSLIRFEPATIAKELPEDA